MKCIGFGFLLLLTFTLHAMEASDAKQEIVSDEDHKACKAVMLEDVLHAFVSAPDGKLQYTPEDIPSLRMTEYQVKNGDQESEIMRRIDMRYIKSKIYLVESIYNAGRHLVEPRTVRGKLISEHKKIHPFECFCGVGKSSKSTIKFDYQFYGDWQEVTLKVFYSCEEVNNALNTIFKKINIMQQSAFSGSRQHSKRLLLPKNFNENLSSIKKLLEHKDA